MSRVVLTYKDRSSNCMFAFLGAAEAPGFLWTPSAHSILALEVDAKAV